MKTFKDQSFSEWWTDTEESHIMDYISFALVLAIGFLFGLGVV